MPRMVVQDADFNTKLGAILDRTESLEPFYRSIEELLLNSTRERFLTQTAPDGTPWAALSPAYKKSKEKRDSAFPDAIGRLNGYLMGLLRTGGSGEHAEVGSDRVYAAMFQLGGTSFAGQRVGYVKLRTNSKGELLRQKDSHLAVFANKRHKLYEVHPYATGYYEVNHPARPFLGFSAEDRAGILAEAEAYITGR